MEETAGAVNIPRPDVQRFAETQAAGVYGAQIGVDVRGLYESEKMSYFLPRENRRFNNFVLCL